MQTLILSLNQPNIPPEPTVVIVAQYILYICLIVGLVGLVVTTYINWRNKRVYNFLTFLGELNFCRASIFEAEPDQWKYYLDNGPSYNELMYKFWLRLRLETFFNEEEIKDLTTLDPQMYEERNFSEMDANEWTSYEVHKAEDGRRLRDLPG